MKAVLFLLYFCLVQAISLNAQNVPGYVPIAGLGGWWSFNGNANDESGNFNNGIVNGATLCPGQNGTQFTAYSFNGVSNTIDLNNPFFGGSQVNTFTIHTVVKINSVFNEGVIWAKDYPWADMALRISDQYGISLFWDNNVTGNRYSVIYSNTNVIQSGQFYSIDIVFQNSVGQIYVNGSPVFTNLLWYDQFGNTLSTSQIDAQCNFIGQSRFGLRYNGGTPTGYFNGIIDEYGIWNRALTQQEISALYNTCTAAITLEPTDQQVSLNSTASFSVNSADPSATYQWQTNQGLGWLNLFDAGQFSGVNTTSLNISNVNSLNNNQAFRCLVSTSGCADTSQVVYLTISTSIDVIEKDRFKLYPNPTKNFVVLKFESFGKRTIQITDQMRRVVKTVELDSNSIGFSVDDLASGVYLVKVGGIVRYMVIE
jgi:hypothetical protein